MKVLTILSVVLGAAAVAAAAHAYLQIYPRYESARKRYDAISTERDRASASRERFLEREYDDAFREYRETEEVLKTEILFGMWIAGGLAVIFGILAIAKKRKLGIAGLLLGLVAAGVSLLVQPVHW